MLTFLVGLYLVFWGGRHFAPDSTWRKLAVQGGTSLVTFSVTTVLITIFASRDLDRQLVSRVTDKLSDHVQAVGNSVGEMTTKVDDSTKKTVDTVKSSVEQTTKP